MESFRPISLVGLSAQAKLSALRVNGFGSLWYFTKVILKRRRLNDKLHAQMCSEIECEHLKDLKEIPRDHFKSTIYTEAFPMWRSLPFLQSDADTFTRLGYSDSYIKWMQYAHNPNRRNLLVSENITNAAKLGSRVRWHFESNALYRSIFPETLPTPAQTWTNYSLHVDRRLFGTGASHGEGTFDFIGVGGALQSRHYDGVVEDDLIGRKAVESPAIMDSTIDYHRLLVGAFDNEDKDHENDELVVGNRWGFHDLNSWIRENETWFRISSHGALGGCCFRHSADQPIFPEEFSFEKLLKYRARLGGYNFSCQFLNNPIAPEDADFRAEWLLYFETYRDETRRLTIKHETTGSADTGAIVRKDLKVNHLSVAMAVDPNHAGNAAAGRCRHAIVVVGKKSNENGLDDFYLLDAWAGHTSYGTLVDKIYEFCEKWKLNNFGLETVAAQKYLKFHLDEKNRIAKRRLRIDELKGEVDTPDGTISRKKEWRIRNVLSPIFERGGFFVQRRHQDFIGEFSSFPKGKYCDLLDALAYIPQILRYSVSLAENTVLRNAYQRRANQVGRPYSHAVQ